MKRQAPLTFVTSEPFLGHFGIGGLPGGQKLLGMFLRKERITALTNTAMTEVAPGKLHLAEGEPLNFAYTVIIPPFQGQEVVRATPGLADGNGFVTVEETYQSTAYPDVYAVGVAAAVTVPYRGAGRRTQDRLPHRDTGACGGDQHHRADPGRAAHQTQELQ